MNSHASIATSNNKGSELNAPAVRATVGATIGFIIGPTSIIAPPLGLFMLPVAKEFGLGRAGFPLLMLMVSLFAGLFSPIAGRVMDRMGIRNVIIPAVILSALAQIALGLTTGSFVAFLAVMAAVGILAGIQNPTAYTKVLAMWYSRRRGFMIALAGAVGGGGGGVLVPLLVERCIDAGGWQMGYMGVGVFILLGTPLLVWLLREPAIPGHAVLQAANPQPVASSGLVGLALGQATMTARFWMILIAMMGASGSLVALTVHVPAWIFDAGGSGRVAATFLSLFALGGICGQLGCGVLLDRFTTVRVCAPFFLLAAIGVAILQVVPATALWIPAAGLLSGMALGAELGLASYLVSRYFGLRNYGQIYGCIYGAMVVASGAGPVLMGIAFEISGFYEPAFAFASAALLFSGLLIASLPKYTFAVAHADSESRI